MNPVGVDPRWEVFEPFQAHLLGDFPLVCVLFQHPFLSFADTSPRHSTLKLTKVNTYGLVFEWNGTSPNLKPVLLAAHQGSYSVDKLAHTKTYLEFSQTSYRSNPALSISGLTLRSLDISTVIDSIRTALNRAVANNGAH